MNYYKRHLGDYAKDTKTLCVYGHGVYTVVLDYYYSEEGPVSDEDVEALVRPKSAAERAVVAKVMGRYFKRDGDHWRHSYADRVIAESQAKSAKAAESAEKRWQCERNANADRPQSDGNASHKPLATSHEPLANKEQRAGDFHAFWFAYPNKTGKGAAMQAYAKALGRADHETLMAAVEAQRLWPQWAKEGGKFIPNPATWLNQQRWLDEGRDPNQQARNVIEEAERIAFGSA